MHYHESQYNLGGGGSTTSKDRHTLAWCLLLFSLPALGFHLPQVVAGWELPRDAVHLTLLSFKPDFPKFGAASLAAMYHVAIAMALTITVCLASVAYCIHWLVTIGRDRLGPHLRAGWYGPESASASPFRHLRRASEMSSTIRSPFACSRS